MKFIFCTLAVILVPAFAAFAQQPTSVPTPPDENEVVKISTNLIQIDVTVTDKKGNVITDLKPDEVEIFENGEKQDISNFSFISNIRPQQEARPSRKGDNNDLPVPPPTAPRPEKVRKTIALVVDDLTLSFASAYWVQDALKKFVNEQMQDGDLVAIIRTGAGIGALQQFTTDKRQLLAAIQKVRFNMAGSGKIGVFYPIEASLSEQLHGTTDSRGNSKDLGDRIEAESNFDREVNEFRESIFASGTLGALNFIIRGMHDLPGRKSIVLLSDGIPLMVRDDRGVPQASRIMDSLRRLTDLANRSSVVVYTIDARGLVVPGLTAEDNTWGLSADQIEGRLQDRRNSLFDTQEGLTYLARQTGGFAMINQNDISKGIGRVLNDQSYYLIGYQPDDETFDPRIRRYNKLEIKVKREGTRVRYRSGFFGISEEQIKKPQLTASQSILNALTSPFAVNDISLRLNALFLAGDKKSLFLRSYLHVDAGDLKFVREADGTYKTTFTLLAMSFGDNGVPVDEYGKSYVVHIKEDAYKRVLQKGFVYDFTFPVKKPGGYQVRVAFHDSLGNKVGSANQFVDIPNLKKNRLALSGIILEGMRFDQWQKLATGASSYDEIKKETDVLTDSSLRQFRSGTVLRFGYDVYNPRIDAAGNPNLTAQIRIFYEGKIIYEGQPAAIRGSRKDAGGSITVTGSARLGDKMPAGDYALQIIAIDNLAKEKRKTAEQFVQFEIVE